MDILSKIQLTDSSSSYSKLKHIHDKHKLSIMKSLVLHLKNSKWPYTIEMRGKMFNVNSYIFLNHSKIIACNTWKSLSSHKLLSTIPGTKDDISRFPSLTATLPSKLSCHAQMYLIEYEVPLQFRKHIS